VNVKHIIKMCVVVLGAALCLQGTTVMAGLVTANQMVPQSQIEAEKIKIQAFIDRAEVMDRLQAMGVVESMSKVRVAAMTNEEVHAMAQKIDTMPAGGRLNDSDLVVILLIILLILII
jgi:cell division protein YceG involved in septum cleavage